MREENPIGLDQQRSGAPEVVTGIEGFDLFAAGGLPRVRAALVPGAFRDDTLGGGLAEPGLERP